MFNKKYILSYTISILFLLLLTFPVVNLFNNKTLVIGIPLILLYIAGTWILLIVLIFRLTRRSKNDNP